MQFSQQTIHDLYLWICKKHPDRFYRRLNKLIFKQKYKVAFFFPFHIGHSRVLKFPLEYTKVSKLLKAAIELWCISESKRGTRKGVMQCSISHRQMTPTLSRVLNAMTWPGKKLSDRKTWWHQHKQPKFQEVPIALILMSPQDSELLCHCSVCCKLTKEWLHTSKQSPCIYRKNLSRKIGPWNCFRAILFMLNLWPILPGSLSRTGW